jgi:hypothetical protein
MITIVQQTPELAPVYNDLVMTVVSNFVTTKFKFKYVFDIFTAQQPQTSYQFIGRVKVTPNPVGYGMLDLGRYLETQVESRVNPTGSTLVVNPNPTDPTFLNIDINNGSTVKYYVSVGEEYSNTIDGQVILYNGNDVPVTGTTITGITGNTCYGFDGVKQYDEGYTWDETDYVLPTGRTFLTNSPRTLYKEQDEFFTISALYGTFSGTPFNFGTLRADVYDQSNSLLLTYPTGSPTGTTITSSDIRIVNTGVNIDTIVSGVTSTWNKIVFRGGYSTGFTENMTVVKKGCPWDKYDPVDILWLNRLGGWDNFRFYGSKDKSVKIERTTYKRAYGTWASTSYDYKTYERGTSNIQTDLTQEGDVMSDFLDRDTVNWLEELLTSPQIFIIESSTKVRPINIRDAEFKNQLRGNTKLRQVSFKYEYSELIRTQQK